MIQKCTCKHDYQDQVYGKDNRVFNKMKKEDMYRCSVCGKEVFITMKKEKGK